MIPRKYYAMAFAALGFGYAFTPPLTVMSYEASASLGLVSLFLAFGLVMGRANHD